MLHTIIPHEMVFGKEYRNKLGKRLTTLNINGVLLEGERNGDYFKVHRVISSNPNVYLNRGKYNKYEDGGR